MCVNYGILIYQLLYRLHLEESLCLSFLYSCLYVGLLGMSLLCHLTLLFRKFSCFLGEVFRRCRSRCFLVLCDEVRIGVWNFGLRNLLLLHPAVDLAELFLLLWGQIRWNLVGLVHLAKLAHGEGLFRRAHPWLTFFRLLFLQMWSHFLIIYHILSIFYFN